jgi:hypothetical protein
MWLGLINGTHKKMFCNTIIVRNVLLTYVTDILRTRSFSWNQLIYEQQLQEISITIIITNNLNMAKAREICTNLKFRPCMSPSDPCMAAVHSGLFWQNQLLLQLWNLQDHKLDNRYKPWVQSPGTWNHANLFLHTKWHGTTSLKTGIFSGTAVRTSNTADTKYLQKSPVLHLMYMFSKF